MSSTQQQEKPVQPPAEGLTEEAKKAEPDAAEQNEQMEKAGQANLPTIT